MFFTFYSTFNHSGYHVRCLLWIPIKRYLL